MRLSKLSGIFCAKSLAGRHISPKRTSAKNGFINIAKATVIVGSIGKRYNKERS